jgi:hypothetical protein
MTRDQSPPPEVAAMLAVERSIPPVPAAAAERVRTRLDASIAAGGGAATAASGLIGKLFLVSVFVIVAGGGLAAYLARDGAAPAPAPARTSAVERRDLAPPPPTNVVPATRPAPAPAPIAAPDEHAARNVHAASTPKPKPEAIALDERELLEQAQRCLAQTDASCALAAIASHAKHFPSGALAEERDALWVQALALSGDTAAANAHARQFLETYPKSVYVTAIRRAMTP